LGGAIYPLFLLSAVRKKSGNDEEGEASNQIDIGEPSNVSEMKAGPAIDGTGKQKIKTSDAKNHGYKNSDHNLPLPPISQDRRIKKV
jgi:hypothetical protein